MWNSCPCIFPNTHALEKKKSNKTKKQEKLRRDERVCKGVKQA